MLLGTAPIMAPIYAGTANLGQLTQRPLFLPLELVERIHKPSIMALMSFSAGS